MKPVIGIDVASDKSVATACRNLNEIFECFTFLHTVSGLRQLQMVLDRLEQDCQARPNIVLEATGHYSMPLCRYFQEHHYTCHVVNPWISSKFNQWKLRKVKTDKIDSLALCRLYYLENLADSSNRPYVFSECKALARACESEKQTMVRQKVQWRIFMDRCFPAFDKIFGDPFSDDALNLLQVFSHPDMVTQHRASTVTLKIKAAFPHHTSRWCQKKSLVLRELAQDCYPAVGLDNVQVRLLLETTRQLQKQIQLVSRMQKDLIELMRTNPQFALLTSIPGLGDYSAAVFLAETGDLRQFASHRQLIAFCGTEPGVYQSGSFTGTRQHLSKHGNARLRAILFMAVVGMVNYKQNSILRAYYEKKRLCEGKPYKVAIFACVNKLLRMILAICTQQEQIAI